MNRLTEQLAELPSPDADVWSRHTKDGEVYLIHWNHATAGDALRQLGKWATDPWLPFNWYDAAVVAQQIRKVKAQLSDSLALRKGEDCNGR